MQKAVPILLCLVEFVRIAFIDKIVNIWAISSVGRALRSHRRGREFESLIVHQLLKTVHFCTVFLLYIKKTDELPRPFSFTVLCILF